MPTFTYKALQADGKIAEGVLEAAGRPDAMRQIETRGLRPVNLAEKAASSAKASKISNPAVSPRKTWRISRACFPTCFRRACR
jgi:type II secretory pathway component PulF